MGFGGAAQGLQLGSWALVELHSLPFFVGIVEFAINRFGKSLVHSWINIDNFILEQKSPAVPAVCSFATMIRFSASLSCSLPSLSPQGFAWPAPPTPPDLIVELSMLNCWVLLFPGGGGDVADRAIDAEDVGVHHVESWKA